MSAQPNMPDFPSRINKALGDQQLRGALRYTADRLYNGRKNAVADMNSQAAENLSLGTLDELKARAKEIKTHTLKHLDFYLSQAAENIEKAGGKVYWASNAADVIAITLEIAKRRQAKSIIKAKSMASEEVHINHALQDAGYEVVESDLGEYIIQLAGETPAHIVIPAIHKTRKQISELFAEAGGVESMPTDTPTLTAFARKTLRKKFMAADIGMSGSNFVVAESGTLCLVTNEGNGRLSTTVPECHIAVVGMEKLVPTMEDLAVLYGLLPRSATGQKISTYFNMLTGPRRTGEADGAEELHVIFMDNGRTHMLGSEYEEALSCIRCGACLNACPVYRNIGGHAYGAIYPGPIGSVISPLLNDLNKWEDLPQACSLCGACSQVCPMSIHLHDHIVDLRSKMVEKGKEPWAFGFVIKLWMGMWQKPWAYRLLSKLGRMGMNMLATKLPNGKKVITSLPSVAAGWTNSRNFPMIAERTFHERWADLEKGGRR